MKILLPLFSCLSAVAVHAQTWTLPPSSLLDGVALKPAGLNAGPAYWGGSSSLGAYAISGDADSDRLVPGAVDSTLGLTWTHAIPASLQSAKNAVTARGGSIRAIFIGETAGALNNFGYSYSGVPAGPDSFTAFTGIQSAGGSPNISFGQHLDISFLPGEASTFDFWLDAVDITRGGVYSLFNTVGGDAANVASQFLWSTQAMSVPTWVPSLGAYANIDTYLVSMEDLRLEAGADRDYSDFRFALQFLNTSGESMVPIPEPAHFAALLTMGAVAGAVYLRRRVRTT
jgi:hypothetical protein